MASFATFYYGKLSPLEITCIQSFMDHGHDIVIFCYESIAAPAHFKTADASSILPQSRLFFYKSGIGKGSVSAFSNLFRYKLLSKFAGLWWVDTDVICLSNKWPEHKNIGAAWESPSLIGSAVLSCNATHAEKLSQRAEILGENILWGQTGPKLLTSYFHEQGLESELLPAPSFYPIQFQNWYMPFVPDCTPEIERRCASSFTLHLWNEMTRRNGLDKEAAPVRRSFASELVAKHNTERFFDSERICKAASRSWRKNDPQSFFGKTARWARSIIGGSTIG